MKPLLLSSIAALLLLATPADEARAQALSPGEAAKVLAGVELSRETLGKLGNVDYPRYQRAVARHWEQYHAQIAEPLEAWARRELESRPGETIFYPFAGADFTTVQRLYPRAGRYVLAAMQQAGRAPDLALSVERKRQLLDAFAAVTREFGRRGFFVTEEMNARFAGEDQAPIIEGLTPILMLMAEREGYDVLDVQPIALKEDGSDVEVVSGRRATYASVRLSLRRRADGRPVILDYLRLDVSDWHLKRNPSAGEFVRRMTESRVVLKAASHLPQLSNFRVIRDAISANAPSLVQDESGLDYAALAAAFDVKLYGRFQSVNKLFDPSFQTSLAAAYAAAGDRPPRLDFSYGYRKKLGTAIQVGTRRR